MSKGRFVALHQVNLQLTKMSFWFLGPCRRQEGSSLSLIFRFVGEVRMSYVALMINLILLTPYSSAVPSTLPDWSYSFETSVTSHHTSAFRCGCLLPGRWFLYLSEAPVHFVWCSWLYLGLYLGTPKSCSWSEKKQCSWRQRGRRRLPCINLIFTRNKCLKGCSLCSSHSRDMDMNWSRKGQTRSCTDPCGRKPCFSTGEIPVLNTVLPCLMELLILRKPVLSDAVTNSAVCMLHYQRGIRTVFPLFKDGPWRKFPVKILESPEIFPKWNI